MASQRRVFVVGVGMTKFEKPGKRDWDYPDKAQEAVSKALQDANLAYTDIEQACVGYVYGDSTCGQRALYSVGLTGIPVYNVNNNCSTGSTALYMAKQFVQGGISDCVLALGFEKMQRGSLKGHFDDRTNPLDKHVSTMLEVREFSRAPFAPQMFGNAGLEHMEKYGTTLEHFAKIAEKNHRHSANNPYSQFRDVYTLEQIMQSPQVHAPLTKLQCCPTSDGAAAAIVCSEKFVMEHGLQNTAVEILGMSMATDLPSSFEEKSCIKVVGFDLTKKAAQEVYRQAGHGPQEVQVVELHDCFSTNELITYEALGLCGIGEGGQLVDRGDVTYGGKYVVNPSGGLISKGHPLGATGLAQCSELCWQIRGQAGPRQVPNVRYALQHNLGLGGAAVVTMYGRPTFSGTAAPRRPVQNQTTATVASSAPTSAASNSGSDIQSVFAGLGSQINRDVVAQVGCVYQFVVPSGSWTVDLKNGDGAVRQGAADSPDVTISAKEADLAALLTGQLQPAQAFMQGKIKIKGNMAAAQKLQILFKQRARL